MNTTKQDSNKQAAVTAQANRKVTVGNIKFDLEISTILECVLDGWHERRGGGKKQTWKHYLISRKSQKYKTKRNDGDHSAKEWRRELCRVVSSLSSF